MLRVFSRSIFCASSYVSSAMIRRKKKALGGAHMVYKFTPRSDCAFDLDVAIASLYHAMKSLLSRKLKALKRGFGLKFQVVLHLSLEKYSFENEESIVIDPFFPSDMQVLFTPSKVGLKLTKALQGAYSKFDAFVEMGSGWVMKRVLDVSVSSVVFELFRGGCSNSSLPPSLRKRKCCFSLRDVPDDKCFIYAVAAGLIGAKRNRFRKSALHDKIVDVLVLDKIKFPVDLKGVKRFDAQNLVSVNVYGYDGVLYPLYLTEKTTAGRHHVNLMLYENHYFCITNLSRLVATHARRSRRKCFVCDYCLSFFPTEKSFNLHQGLCRKTGVRFKLPSSSASSVQFENFSNMIPSPFVIYCDMETMIQRQRECKKGKMISKRKHVPISVGAVTVCRVAQKYSSPPFLYTGKDCIDVLFQHLEEEVKRILMVLDCVYEPCSMSSEERRKHRLATSCHMCRRSFEEHHLEKVRDHCHLSGKYRFPLCSVCNLTRAKSSPHIPVFFHGLSNYDSHFLVQKLADFDCGDVHVIPRNVEKFLSMSIGCLTFKDSYQFLGESLSTLATNLKSKSSACFRNLNRWIEGEKRRELLMGKGIFPYSHLTDEAVLQEPCLPDISSFRNDITGLDISRDDYSLAQLVWKEFNCKTFKDYLEVYLLGDVLLLADVYENFRTNCLTDYSLDACHYFSSPHFTYDAFLRHSGMQLDLFTDLNQYLFITRGVRGGQSMVVKRYARANNKYMKGYDPSCESSFILYLDANNLYGWAMQQPMPFRNFRFMSDDQLTLDFLMGLPEDGPVGCIVECTLTYPASLHADHADYPLAPVKMRIPYASLSPVAKLICDKHKLKRTTRAEKLLATFHTRANYVLHYRNLQLYIKLGMKLQALHGGLIFDQAPFIRSYVNMNSERRSQATNAFDVSFYKLLTNSLYGKMMENPEKRTRFKLCNNQEDLLKCTSKFNYKRTKRINKRLVGVEMKHPQVPLNKPYYVGMSILELSKYHMFDFHYNVMKPIFGNRFNLLYTDTDSLIYEIRSDDVYSELSCQASEHFDFSNFPSAHTLKSDRNKRVPGTFKDECAGKVITEFVGLRSKMYSLRLANSEDHSVAEVKVAKGVSRPVVMTGLRFDSFLRCLTDNVIYEHEFKSIRSFSHSVYTTNQSKISLSPFEDKRFLVDMFHSRPYGYVEAGNG